MERKTCSVCGRSREEVSLLLQGPRDQFVCCECVRLYADLLERYSRPAPRRREERPPLLPHELKRELDRAVVAQDEAKLALSVAVYHHQLLKQNPAARLRVKSNLLLIGPTGVGKTWLVENLARLLSVPCVIADATAFTEAGYVGEDADHVLSLLYDRANGDRFEAEHGIVFLDEIDKLARVPEGNRSSGRDVSGEGVQQALLKLMEGKTVSVSVAGENGAGTRAVELDTRNILFVLSGAFVGLRPPENGDFSSALIDYGLIPELVGRAPAVVLLHPLGRAELRAILAESERCLLRDYRELFALDGTELLVSDGAVDRIVDYAGARGLGARGLFSALHRVLSPVRYAALEAGEKRVEITEKTVSALLPELGNQRKGGEPG